MSHRSLLDAGETLLRDVADGDVRIARPDWKNPFSPEGAGLEFVSKLPFSELIGKYRDLLIALTHYAQYLRVYAPKGAEPDTNAVRLDEKRNCTDAIWHTDEVHRDNGSVTVVLGESPVATGIAQKSAIAAAWLRRVPPFLSSFGWVEDLRREARGYSAMFTENAGMQRLFEAYEDEAANEATLSEFWERVRDVNLSANAEWIGMTPGELGGMEQGIVVSKGVYHNRALVADSLELAGRRKRRIELQPEPVFRGEIDLRMGDVAAGADAEIDIDWLRRRS